VQAAATVLDEIMGTADKAIPEEVLKSAECVAVVPSLLKGGFVVGARYGRRSRQLPHGERLERASLLHGQAAVASASRWRPGHRPDHARHETKRHEEPFGKPVPIGSRCSAAAGPVGSSLPKGNTDWKMRAEILTYSRARDLCWRHTERRGGEAGQGLHARSSTAAWFPPRPPDGLVEPPKDSQPFLESLYSGQSKRRTTKTLRAGLGSNQNSGRF